MVLVISEQYPSYLQPISISIGSAISTFLSPGTQCGTDEFSPIATIGANETPSAPFVLKYLSISKASSINFSVFKFFSYSSVINNYNVQALAPTIILKFYLMSFHFIQKENLIQENKALSLRLKIIII